MKKKDKKKMFRILLGLGILVGIIFGAIIGMIFQQAIFVVGAIEVGKSLEGTEFNIEIDFNETMIVDRFFELFNKTIIEGDLNDSKQ